MNNTPHDSRLDRVLPHLYVNPLERCNLNCKICYTKKTDPVLSAEAITAFVDRYHAVFPVQSVTFCGGEVFTLPFFTDLINTFNAKGIFVSVITNGTIDKLGEIHMPNSTNIIVSIDGLRDYHDKNRGDGMWDRSMAFLTRALNLGFHAEVFSIVTGQNFPHIDEFEQTLTEVLGRTVSVTYHPRKPLSYLLNHPVSNVVGDVDGFDFLTPDQLKEIMKTRRTFPPKELGCYQISLMSDGRVFGCCEGILPIGSIDDDPQTLISALEARLHMWDTLPKRDGCLGCTQSDFLCGLKDILYPDSV